MSGIIMSNEQRNIVAFGTPVYQEWEFDPDPVIIDYYHGQPAMPAPIVIHTKFQDIIGTPLMNGRSNPRYTCSIVQASGLPVLAVMSNSEGYYTGPNVYNEYEGNGIQTDFTYTFQNLNLLQTGTTSIIVMFRIVAEDTFGDQVTVTMRAFTIRIRVFSADTPQFTPSEFTFHWPIGLSGTTSRPFTVNADLWVLRCPKGFAFSPASGVFITAKPDGGFEATGQGEKTLNLIANDAVVPAEITQNPLYFNLVINGGILVVPIRVYFLFLSGLFISTQSLYFASYKGTQEAQPQTINMNYEGNYRIEGLPFVTLLPSTGTGSTDIVVKPMYSGNLEPGTYSGIVLVFDTDTNLKIGQFTITYVVYDMVQTPYPQGMAFTLDDVNYEFVSQVADTYFDVAMKTKVFSFYEYEPKEYLHNFRVPLFNNRQLLNVGQIVHRLMDSLPHFNLVSDTMYYPAEVSLDIVERKHSDASVVRTAQLDPVRFIAGMNPGLVAGNALLDINPGPSRVTPNGEYFINYLISGNPMVQIYKNGELKIQYGLSPHVRFIKIYMPGFDAAPGDVLEVRLVIDEEHSISKFLKVFPEGYNSNFIIWENEYKLKSIMEMTGKYQVKSELEHRTATVFPALVEQLEKYDSIKTSKFTINTGYLMKSDQVSVESLMRSKRAVLIQGGRHINIVPISKQIINVDDDRELIHFDLEFQINRQTNEEVYSF